MMLHGYVTGCDTENIYITAPSTEQYLLDKREISECEIWLHDGRQLSPKQRNKIFAMIGDITEWMSGFDKNRIAFNETLRQMQLNYIIGISPENIRRQLTMCYCQLSGIDWFSLAQRGPDTADMTTARGFIDWLVELCIQNGIPCSDTLLNRCEDIGRYLYACLANKRCCLCGEAAELHHVDAVGSGRSRKEIIHLGMEALSLCRKHHTEIHTIGRKSFCEKYHVFGIKIDEYLCGVWKLKAA